MRQNSFGKIWVTAGASPATIEIDNFAFAPAALTVTAGTTVIWKNEDDSPHRVGSSRPNPGLLGSARRRPTRHS